MIGLTKEIEEIIKECKQEIESCGFTLPYIKYENRTNITHMLGTCYKRGDNYRIELSIPHIIKYLERGERDKIKDTVLHEMCHALPNGMNHKGQWKVYTSVLNRKYGYNLKRCADNDEVITELVQQKTKYTIVCQNCKEIYYYSRKPKCMNNLSNCSCGKCKTKGSLILK